MPPVKNTHMRVHDRENHRNQTSGVSMANEKVNYDDFDSGNAPLTTFGGSNGESEFINAESHLPQHADRQVAGVLDKESTVQSLKTQFVIQQNLSTNPDSTNRYVSIGLKKRWHERYQLLIKFKEQNGHCLVNHNTPVLGSWVTYQRQSKKKGTLLEDYEQKLNAIGFEWLADKRAIIWEDTYQDLVEFTKKHGHLRVNKKKDLDVWVQKQRKAYKKGKLREDRFKKLNDLGFNWERSEYAAWYDKHALLVEFQKEHGNCLVKKEKNPTLYEWVIFQRALRTRGHLSNKRIKKLKDIGFEWQSKQRQRRTEAGVGMVTLKQLDAPITTVPTPQEKDDRVKKFNGIGFEWEPQPHQQTPEAAAGIMTLKQLYQPITTELMPQDVTSQPFTQMNHDNGDSNICEEFQETVAYAQGDSEHWV